MSNLSCKTFFDVCRPVEGVITQAVIAFAEPQDAAWYFDGLFQLFAGFYNGEGNEGVVFQIYPAFDGTASVGYLALPEHEYDQSFLDQAFWASMNTAGCAEGREFIGAAPLAGTALVDGCGFASVLGYSRAKGPEMPLDAINYVLRMLVGQAGFQRQYLPFLYPVSKGSSALISGIWVAQSIHGLNDDPYADDAGFHGVRAQYDSPDRGTARLLGRALETFSDYTPREF